MENLDKHLPVETQPNIVPGQVINVPNYAVGPNLWSQFNRQVRSRHGIHLQQLVYPEPDFQGVLRLEFREGAWIRPRSKTA
jgi:hypothetical protein